MVDVAFIFSQAWVIFLLSIAVTAVLFPLVFFGTFIYDSLLDKYRKTPKILLMLFVTFLAVLVAITLIEFYLEFTLPLALKSSAP